jgi:tetratricopeptide (TPR) repeat protein
LIARAECSLRSGLQCDAASDLKRAFELLDRYSGMMLAAGICADLARWWLVTAMLRNASDDLDGAVAAWQNAVAKCKEVASMPHTATLHSRISVAYMLAGLAGALQANGRSQEADEVNAERNALVRSFRLPPGVNPRKPTAID